MLAEGEEEFGLFEGEGAEAGAFVGAADEDYGCCGHDFELFLKNLSILKNFRVIFEENDENLRKHT